MIWKLTFHSIIWMFSGTFLAFGAGVAAGHLDYVTFGQKLDLIIGIAIILGMVSSVAAQLIAITWVTVVPRKEEQP